MSIDEQGMTLRAFVPDDAPRMVDLQRRCLAQCPDTGLLPQGFYYAPGFAGGRNIVCAVDAAGSHVGHAMVFPNAIHERRDAWMLWLDLRVDPDLDEGDALRDRLLALITDRAREVQRELGDHRALLYATYFEQGEASIAYLRSRGFEHIESMFLMRRDLRDSLPEIPKPDGVEVRPWQMASEQEQRRYLAAYAAAFGKDDRTLENLQHLIRSPFWDGGTSMTAFEGEDVVGSVLVYYDPDPTSNPSRTGLTEYVFVRPEWRRRGIARHLLARSLALLKERGLAHASLEVLAENPGALSLYEELGYVRLCEELTLSRWLDEGAAE